MQKNEEMSNNTSAKPVLNAHCRRFAFTNNTSEGLILRKHASDGLEKIIIENQCCNTKNSLTVPLDYEKRSPKCEQVL